MVIYHAIILLKQDADIPAVKEIVKAYKKATFDELNYVVYLNADFRKVQDFLEELYPFTYATKLSTETF